MPKCKKIFPRGFVVTIPFAMCRNIIIISSVLFNPVMYIYSSFNQISRFTATARNKTERKRDAINNSGPYLFSLHESHIKKPNR